MPINKIIRIFSYFLLVIFVLSIVKCASKPKFSKAKIIQTMQSEDVDEIIEDFTKNYWRAYILEGAGEYKGSEMASLMAIGSRCFTYYNGSHDRVFTAKKFNPKFVDLSSETVKEFIDKYKNNVNSACRYESVEEKNKKTDISVAFEAHFFPQVEKKFNVDISRLESLYKVKRREELGYD